MSRTKDKIMSQELFASICPYAPSNSYWFRRASYPLLKVLLMWIGGNASKLSVTETTRSSDVSAHYVSLEPRLVEFCVSTVT